MQGALYYIYKGVFILFNKIIKEEIVLIIAWILAIITMFIVKPNISYINYIDFYTLILLFCLMTIICGLENNNIFQKIITLLLKKINNTRQLYIILIFITFFSSMLITNDVALIVFVPFTIKLLKILNLEKEIINLVVMQTISANLGSMATPIGNPQNLYLYSNYNINFIEFIIIILPFTILSLFLFLIFIFTKKSNSIHIEKNIEQNFDNKKYSNIIYLILFIFCLLTIGRILNMYILFIIVFISILIIDKSIFKNIGYSLLFTFVGFFIFVGNIQKMEFISNIIKNIMKFDNVIISVFISQFISNVPASILLSKFTNNFNSLIIGTNIGGLGTLIASMASLISYKYVIKENISYKNKYILNFTLFNILFLILLLILYFIIK